MSDDNEPKKPDYINSLYFKTDQGRSKRVDIPASWVNESGRIITETPLGRLVQTPRKMLEEMRSEEKEHAQTQDIEQ